MMESLAVGRVKGGGSELLEEQAEFLPALAASFPDAPRLSWRLNPGGEKLASELGLPRVLSLAVESSLSPQGSSLGQWFSVG